jgi:hypothetical protein
LATPGATHRPTRLKHKLSRPNKARLGDTENHPAEVIASYKEFTLGGQAYYFTPGGFLYRKGPGSFSPEILLAV